MKRIKMMKSLIGLILCSFLFVTAFSACEREEGPMEETGEAVEESVEETGDAVEDAGEETGEAVEEAGE